MEKQVAYKKITKEHLLKILDKANLMLAHSFIQDYGFQKLDVDEAKLFGSIVHNGFLYLCIDDIAPITYKGKEINAEELRDLLPLAELDEWTDIATDDEVKYILDDIFWRSTPIDIDKYGPIMLEQGFSFSTVAMEWVKHRKEFFTVEF